MRKVINKLNISCPCSPAGWGEAVNEAETKYGNACGVAPNLMAPCTWVGPIEEAEMHKEQCATALQISLRDAFKEGRSLEVMQLLLAKKVDINRFMKGDIVVHNALRFALQHNKLSMFKTLLLDSNIDVKKAPVGKVGPLYLVASKREGAHFALSLLMKGNVDIASAISDLSYHGCAKGIKVLLAAKTNIDVNKVPCTNSCTPAFFAARNGHIEVVKLLFANGAITNSADLVDLAANPETVSLPTWPEIKSLFEAKVAELYAAAASLLRLRNSGLPASLNPPNLRRPRRTKAPTEANALDPTTTAEHRNGRLQTHRTAAPNYNPRNKRPPHRRPTQSPQTKTKNINKISNQK